MANQTNAIATINPAEIAEGTTFSVKQVELIAEQIMPGASADDLMLFAQVASSRGLDPFRKHIYAVSRRTKVGNDWVDKWSYQVSIDGLRLIAQRTGRYLGQTEPQWCGPDGVWRDVWLDDEPPAAARVGVYVKGNPAPLYAVALFKNFAQRTRDGALTKFWKEMPEHMISKVAESQALRKAFPEEAGGLYSSEEMQQADAPELIESHGRVVDRSTGEITATVEEPDPDAELNAAKRDLWGLVKGWGWTAEDLELVVADTYGDVGVTTAAKLNLTQLQTMRRELAATDPAERDDLIALLRKGRAA